MLLQRSVSWRQSNEPLLTIIFTFSRDSPQFTRSTLISSTATRFLRSAHIFSRSTKQIHGQGGDYFFPWEREHTRRVATSYLLSFASTLFVSGFSLFTIPCPCCCAEPAPVSSTRHWAFSFRAPSSAASVLWVLLFHHRWPHPFSDTPLTISANRYAFLAMSLPYDMVRGDLEGFVFGSSMSS